MLCLTPSKNGLKQKIEVQLIYLVGELPKYYWASKNAGKKASR